MKKVASFPADPFSTSSSLLCRLSAWNDQEGWKEFFDRYWRLIYSAAIRSGLTEAEAQDVIQETLLSTAKSIHKFKHRQGRGSFRGWLRNLTHWRIADQLRRRLPGGAEAVELDLDEIPEVTEAGVDAFWEQEWRENLFNAAVDQVKRKVDAEHYQIFDLRTVQQMSAAEVAETFGVSVAQVYLIQRRIADQIKKEIRRLEKDLY